MLLYHGSQTAGIEVLLPRVSNHEKPLIYLSAKRENVVVYLSNAVKKYHDDNEVAHIGAFYTWASYGFNSDGLLVIDEYYPDATRETYKGVCGYIYSAEADGGVSPQSDIPFAFTSEAPVKVAAVEFVRDAYDEILSLERRGLLAIRRYAEQSDESKAWIKRTITDEYHKNRVKLDYTRFLRAKFPFLEDVDD